MTDQADSARPTPPKQTPDDPNTADRRLSEEQKREAGSEPAPPDTARDLPAPPDPEDVGEAG